MIRKEFNPVVLRERIKLLRTELGMNRKAFSNLVGSTTGSNVCWWESGERVPSAYYCFQIAQSCGVSADWLLGLTDERKDVDYDA